MKWSKRVGTGTMLCIPSGERALACGWLQGRIDSPMQGNVWAVSAAIKADSKVQCEFGFFGNVPSCAR